MKSRLLQDSSNQMNSWKEIRQLWEQKIEISLIKDSNNPQTLLSKESSGKLIKLQDCDEFIQDLNKKVVMTKAKLQQISKLEKNENQNLQMYDYVSKHNKNSNYKGINSPKHFTIQEKIQQKQQQSHTQFYKTKVAELQYLLMNKDKEISELKQNISHLQNKVHELIKVTQSSKLSFSQIFQKSPQCHPQSINQKHQKSLQIDINKINNQHLQSTKIQFHALTTHSQSLLNENQNEFQHITKQDSDQNFEHPKLPKHDPVFKIPCLSPTMLQMKCIQKMEAQRRSKLRQLRKECTGTKTIVSQIQNLAAGVASPVTQEMIQDAQNPLKNRFIRKPMSPVFASLYKSPKNNEVHEEKQNYPSNEQKMDNLSIEQEISAAKQPQKLNLPYFLSKKKKNKQNE